MSKNGQRLFRNFDPYITSPFGYRINPISKERSLHAGVDYGTNGKNIPCYGLTDGEVARTGFQKALGNYVYVNYPSLGHGALYQHLDSIKVKKGEKVTKDTVIGITGATGEVTLPGFQVVTSIKIGTRLNLKTMKNMYFQLNLA